MLARETKRKKLVQQYFNRRLKLKTSLKKATNLDEKFEISFKLQQLPKDSSRTRLRNRCWKTGKPRGYSRFFGLCRNVLREMAHDCLLPGVIKASW